MALRGSVLPGDAARRRGRPRPALPRAGHRRARDSGRSRASGSRWTDLARSDLFRATARTSTRSASTSTAAATSGSSRTSTTTTTRRTRCSTSSATASTTSASTTTCRGSSDDAPRRDGGVGAPLRRAVAARVARARSSAVSARRSPSSSAARAARAVELLVFTRWVLVMNAFERALYAIPRRSRHALVGARLALPAVTPPDGRRAPDWAAKIHIAVAPVYYHTYLYGAIVALQLTAASSRGRRDRRPPGRRRAAAREALRPGAVGPLGPARRGRVRLAALGRVARARRRGA